MNRLVQKDAKKQSVLLTQKCLYKVGELLLAVLIAAISGNSVAGFAVKHIVDNQIKFVVGIFVAFLIGISVGFVFKKLWDGIQKRYSGESHA